MLVRITINGKTINFQREVSLTGKTIGSDFFEEIFTGMGAEVTGKYTLEFTLSSTNYNELVKEDIITDGQTLVISLYKTQDLKMDDGLDGGTTPDQDEYIAVENIVINTSAKSYFRGSDIHIEFSLTPSNTSDVEVEYTTNSHGNGKITAKNGNGELVLKSVTTNDKVTFTIKNGKTAEFVITLTDSVKEINFIYSNITMDQNEQRSMPIENYDVIKGQISNLTYKSSNTTIATVDNQGKITALKNGVATITATATSNGNNLTASYQVDVLGLVDFTSNDTFIKSAQGTYNITFFGTRPGSATGGDGFLCSMVRGQTNVPVTNDCGVFEGIFGSGTCKGTTFASQIEVDKSKLAGQMTISIDNQGSASINTKVLMTHADIIKNSQNDQYQYTVYRPTYSSNAMNSSSGSAVTDIKGRNLTENNLEWSNSTFEVKLYQKNQSKTIQVYSVMKNKIISAGGCNNMSINPETYIIAEKISSQVTKMDYSDVSLEPFNRVTGVNPSVSNFGSNAPTY